MRHLLFVLLTALLIAPVASAQELPCDPELISAAHAIVLDSVTTLEELERAANDLSEAVATCRYADSEIGISRVNPIPADETAQVTDAFSIKVLGYADITAWLVNQDYDVDSGAAYITVFYEYQCDLPPDEACENYQTIAAAVTAAGNVYEAENIRASDFEWGWELYGGATKSLYSIFAIDESETDDFVVRFQDYDEDYAEFTRFFEPGEQRQVQ